MIELESQDPRVIKAMNHLAKVLSSFVDNKDFNALNLEAMRDIVDGHYDSFRREHGATFPRLTLFALPSVRFVVFYRYELEQEEIRRKMLMLLRQFAVRRIRISAMELASAITKAWPFYRPEEVIVDARKDPKGYRQYDTQPGKQ